MPIRRRKTSTYKRKRTTAVRTRRTYSRPRISRTRARIARKGIKTVSNTAKSVPPLKHWDRSYREQRDHGALAIIDLNNITAATGNGYMISRAQGQIVNRSLEIHLALQNISRKYDKTSNPLPSEESSNYFNYEQGDVFVRYGVALLTDPQEVIQWSKLFTNESQLSLDKETDEIFNFRQYASADEFKVLYDRTIKLPGADNNGIIRDSADALQTPTTEGLRISTQSNTSTKHKHFTLPLGNILSSWNSTLTTSTTLSQITENSLFFYIKVSNNMRDLSTIPAYNAQKAIAYQFASRLFFSDRM